MYADGEKKASWDIYSPCSLLNEREDLGKPRRPAPSITIAQGLILCLPIMMFQAYSSDCLGYDICYYQGYSSIVFIKILTKIW